MRVIVCLKKKPEESNFFINTYIKAIKIWTWSQYFHSEIIIDDKRISSYPQRGVEIHQFNDNFDFEHFDYFEIDVPNLTQEQEKVLWQYLYDQLHTGYDWDGIFFSQVFKLGINDPEKWFCSEITTKILQLVLYEPVLDCLPNKVSPAKLYKLIKNKSTKIEPKG